MKGNIASFESMGLVDGPGVRFVVFMQGCPLRCAYCHNPEMWDGSIKKIEMTPEELLAKVKRYQVYFKDSGGVTVSGGEPLLQAEFVTQFFRLCKGNGIHTALDTSGFGVATDELLDVTDLVILDVKELDKNKYERLTKQKMQKFCDFLAKCQEKHKKLWIRQVIVPGYNDTEESVLKLKEFVSNLENVEKVELLPFHDMAKKKYKDLGIKNPLEDTPAMDKQRCKQLERLLN